MNFTRKSMGASDECELDIIQLHNYQYHNNIIIMNTFASTVVMVAVSYNCSPPPPPPPNQYYDIIIPFLGITSISSYWN